MELIVTASLSAGDFVKAAAAQFPGEGVTAWADEKTADQLHVVFDNQARTLADANAIVTAWSDPAAELARAKADAAAQVDAKLQAVMATWAYTFNGASYQIPITDTWLTRVQAANTGLGLAGGGAATMKFPIAAGVLVDMNQAQVQAMGLAAFTFEQAALENTHAILAEVYAATTAAAIDAVDKNAGWPAP